RVMIAAQRFLDALLPLQEVAEPDPRLDEIGPELERQIVALEGFVETLAARQQRAEARKIIGIGRVVAYCLRDELDGRIDLVPLRVDKTKQMHRTRLWGIGGEQLPADLSRRRKLARPEMPHGRLEQRRRLFLHSATGLRSRHDARGI